MALPTPTAAETERMPESQQVIRDSIAAFEVRMRTPPVITFDGPAPTNIRELHVALGGRKFLRDLGLLLACRGRGRGDRC